MTKENDVVSVETDNPELVAVTRLDFEAFFERAFREINPNTPLYAKLARECVSLSV